MKYSRLTKHFITETTTYSLLPDGTTITETIVKHTRIRRIVSEPPKLQRKINIRPLVNIYTRSKRRLNF